MAIEAFGVASVAARRRTHHTDAVGCDVHAKRKVASDAHTRAALLAFLKTHLADSVSDVRVSDRLTDSPVCLVASDTEADLNVARILKVNQNYDVKARPVLEINADHPLIDQLDALAETSTESVALQDAADLLLDQARIIQGQPVDDPAAFARRMADFLRRGLAA